MRQAFSVLAGLALAAVAGGTASAQPLGEVAKKEEARRKAVTTPGKVYTNESLRGVDIAAPAPAPSPQQPDAATAQAPSPSGGQETPDQKAAQARAEERKKDEAHWRARMTEARTGLERARMFQEALQSRINALSTDFVNRDDPAQRDVIATDRAKALAELERVKKEIAAYEKEILTIEEEARKAGVPPGWLR